MGTKRGEQEEPLGGQASASVGLLDPVIGVIGIVCPSGGHAQATTGLAPLAPEDVPGPGTSRSDKALAPEGVGTVHVQRGDHGVFGAQPFAVLRPSVTEQALPDGPRPPLTDGRIQPALQFGQGAGGVEATVVIPRSIRKELLHPAGHPEDGGKQISLLPLMGRGFGVQTAGPIQKPVGRKSHTGPFALQSVVHPHPVFRTEGCGIVFPPPRETERGRKDPIEGRLVAGSPVGSMDDHSRSGGKPRPCHPAKRMRPSTNRLAA